MGGTDSIAGRCGGCDIPHPSGCHWEKNFLRHGPKGDISPNDIQRDDKCDIPKFLSAMTIFYPNEIELFENCLVLDVVPNYFSLQNEVT